MSIINKLKERKILVLGLEKSGKTTIILNFIGKFNLSDYISLDETNNPNIIKFEKGGLKFIIWDFNGKEIYRNEFLQNFNDLIINTKEIFYIIDIQDVKSYELTFKFLQKIIDKLKKLNMKIELTFFLHKYDHDLFKRFPDINIETIDRLIERIKNVIPPDVFYEIYKTTIYTVLDKTHVY
ncbi:MAG: ADP-ribosylation factor-like protein [Candidatus Odinarchaeota archaeon]